MVVFPEPTIVTVLPSIVATFGSELVYVINPSLLVVGGTSVKSPSPIIFAGTEKLDKTVLALFTWNSALIVADVYSSVLPWVAVMIAFPPSRMVTTSSLIVQTSVFELV